MTQSEAQLILGVEAPADTEDIVEAYEEAVFEQASFFMRRVFIPKLAEARMAKLRKVEQAATTLGVDTAPAEAVKSTHLIEEAKDHAAVVEEYNSAEMKLKLSLANASSSAEALAVYEAWIDLFQAYADRFLELCSESQSAGPSKISAAPIFVEFQNASDTERINLIRQECNRLKKLRS